MVVEFVALQLGPLQREGRYLEPRVPPDDVDVVGVQVAAAQLVVPLCPMRTVQGKEVVEKAAPGRAGCTREQEHLHRADSKHQPHTLHERTPRKPLAS